MSKYKYYFKQPKSALVKDILYWVGASGIVLAAVVAPKAASVFIREYMRYHPTKKRHSIDIAFRRLLKDGSIKVRREGRQIYIALTEKGRKKAGWFQINGLEIKKPKRWDGRWRIVIFDIPHTDRLVREALRGFLKRLGFYPLQKSVWVYPFDCRDEIDLLKDFFGISADNLRLIISDSIGEDYFLRRKFNLR